MSDMKELFHPRSIAMYGASNNVSKPSGRPLRYLIDQKFEGNLYPINPKYEVVQGVPCYPSVEACYADIDLAIIGVPAAKVLNALRDCAKGHVRYSVILTSGFGEMGEKGRQMQKELVDFARSVGMRLLGPNCLGLMNFKDRIPMTFMVALEDSNVPTGPIALASQSGAFGGHLYGMARSMDVGFNYWITTGNEADIQLNECIEYLASLDSTRVIAGYMEDARNGEKLAHALDFCAAQRKPVVILKVGKTAAGSKAASSHTGALAGNAAVYHALFRQKGVIEANDVYELLDDAAVLAQNKKAGKGRVAIITVSGGAGVLLVDNCTCNGLKVAELQAETKAKLKEVLPAFAAVENPIDVTAQIAGSPGMLGNVLDLCVKDPGVDIVVLYLGLMQSSGEILASQIQRAYDSTEKMIAVTWIEGPQQQIHELRKAGVMVYPEPVRCMKALGVLAQYTERQCKQDCAVCRHVESKEHKEIRSWLKSILEKRGSSALAESESRKILEAYDIPVVPGGLADSPEKAVQIAQKVGYPVVIKFDSCHVLHKSDVGGVILNINSERELKEAYPKLLHNVKESFRGELPVYNGVLVEKMMNARAELLIGSKNDPVFGPTVVFGVGGIFVELLQEVSLRIAPLQDEDVVAMMREVKAARILDGLRGQKACDKGAVQDILLRFSDMVVELRDLVSEVDVNPLFAFSEGNGAVAADALFILKE